MPSQRMRDYWESAATYDAAEDGLPERVDVDVPDCRTPADNGQHTNRTSGYVTFTAGPPVYIVRPGLPDYDMTKALQMPAGSIWTDNDTGEVYRLCMVQGGTWINEVALSAPCHEPEQRKPVDGKSKKGCAGGDPSAGSHHK